jgi:glycosyltransferase involved in cell wall biosynthesis
MISFIIPAHHEEARVGRCVSAIRNEAECLGEPHETLVADDAANDATASMEHRQIAATRNAGAQQAHGDVLFFVEADTLTNAPVIRSASRAIRAGAIDDGCVPRFEGWLPWWFRLIEPLIEPAIRLARFLPSGPFRFCTRSAFLKGVEYWYEPKRGIKRHCSRNLGSGMSRIVGAPS